MAIRPDSHPEKDTLNVRLESADEFYANLRGTGADALSLRSETELARLFSPSNVRLLRELDPDRPRGVADLAASLDRDPDDVADALRVLDRFGLVDADSDVDGTVEAAAGAYDGIEITIPLD